MRIISAATENYYPFVSGLHRACSRLGYDHTIYALGPVGVLSSVGAVPVEIPERLHQCIQLNNMEATSKSPYKPFLIGKALEDYPGEFIVWIDADAFPIKRFDEVVGDYDLGVTLRRPDERRATSTPEYDGYLNAGVMFFRNSPMTRAFVSLWEAFVPLSKTRTDQETLNRLLRLGSALDNQDNSFSWAGLRVRVFPTDKYNNYYCVRETPPEDTKILHIKAARKETDPHYYAKFFEKYTPQEITRES